MTATLRSPISLTSVTTGANILGDTVTLRKPCRAFGVGVTMTASTKASVRLQGSVDGLSWTDLGAAASTFAASGQFGTTSLMPVQFVRVKQMSMVTKANMRLRATVIGY